MGDDRRNVFIVVFHIISMELDEYKVGNANTGVSVTSVNGKTAPLLGGIDVTRALEDILHRLRGKL